MQDDSGTHESRTCRYCGQSKPIRQFPVALTTTTKVYRRRKCDTCHASAKYRRRRAVSKWFEDIKCTLSCRRCGNRDFRVLEFHHPSASDKEFAVADMVRSGFGRRRVLAEVSKCETLCANCHRIVHWEEKHKEKAPMTVL